MATWTKFQSPLSRGTTPDFCGNNFYATRVAVSIPSKSGHYSRQAAETEVEIIFS